MIAHRKPLSRFEMAVETFTDWIKHRRELRDLRQLDRIDFDRIASDLTVSPEALEELVRQGPHSADELPKMLKALGVEEAALANAQPLMLRDMERVCAICGQKRQCDRDLVAGTAAEHYQDYCPNAPTIAQLRKPAPK
jgi:transcriptional regulator with XRE-family HTH domain